MKYNNYKLIITLMLFIFLGLTCFKLNDISQKIISENDFYEDINEVYLLSDYYVNVVINHCCDGSFYLVEMAETDNNNAYYLYASNITERLYVLYMNKDNYKRIVNHNEIKNLIGTVRDINGEVLQSIMDNNEGSDFYLNNKKTLSNLLEKEVYIDTVNIDYKSTLVYDILFCFNLLCSLLGVLFCIIIIFINNIVNIKHFINKHGIYKILFILSFIPYFITLLLAIICTFTGVNWFFDTLYGIEAFKLIIILSLMIFYPVYIIVFIYQLFYIIRYLIKKKK